MKATKIIYWIFTGLLIALMLLSAFTSLRPNPDGVAMMEHLGYPYNVLVLLSVLKILGVLAIVIPGLPRLKEWAYAGFTFDLGGAVFAGLMAGDSIVLWIPVLIGLVLVFGSYLSYHRLGRQRIQPA